MDVMLIIWICAIAGCVVVEALSPQLVGIWFAAAALVSLVLALFGVAQWVQVIAFLVISTLLLLFTRPLARRVMKGSAARTNADRAIGETAMVMQEINNDIAEGQVKVLGQVWSARSQSGDVIPAGAKVAVRAIEGVKVIVELIT